jgi:hypothetical protein
VHPASQEWGLWCLCQLSGIFCSDFCLFPPFILLIHLSSHFFRSLWTCLWGYNPILLHFVGQNVPSLAIKHSSYWHLCLFVTTSSLGFFPFFKYVMGFLVSPKHNTLKS